MDNVLTAKLLEYLGSVTVEMPVASYTSTGPVNLHIQLVYCFIQLSQMYFPSAVPICRPASLSVLKWIPA